MSEISRARRYYWSLRREIWEYPSIWVVPLAAATVSLLGFLISVSRLPAVTATKPAQFLARQPYDFAIGLIMLAAYIVAVFYSMDALYGERRDRSILFWKSLPVSDTMTVLAKLTIPMLLIPVIESVVTIATLLIMLLLNPAHPPLLRTSTLLVYHLLTVHSLWWAPLFGWLLLISAWAGRAPFVWATVPLFAISIVERIAFNTAGFQGFLNTRFSVSPEAIVAHGKLPTDPMTRLTPDVFVTSWGLWIGLAVAAVFIAGAIRLRRYRGPI
jgi:ABC-2 type transport system permease protein